MLDRGLRPQARRTLLASLAAVLVAAGGLAVWWFAARETGSTSVARHTGSATVEALRGYPPIVVVWGQRARTDYTASGDLYVVHAKTGIRRVKAWRPLSGRTGQLYGTFPEARWSPDRKQIAFLLSVWCWDPCAQVAVVSADGRGLRKRSPLFDPGGAIGNLAWSPDGRTLVYSEAFDLRTVASGGGRSMRIFHSRQYGFSGTDWSPDGRYVAVGVGAGEETGEIVKVSRDGTKVVQLAHGADPQWSPDGRMIAFIGHCRAPGPDGCDIDVIGAEGRGIRRLVSNASADALWSPDGRSILFTTRRGVRVVGRDGHRLRVLTSDRTDRPTAWSPDGSRILFVREARRKHSPHPWSELWVMNADGSGQTRLPFNRTDWSVLSADWGH
jgi:Tol biopolymer transport system component